MGTSVVRNAIVGCGMCARIHLDRLLALDEVAIVGCADPELQAARAVADRASLRAGYGSSAASVPAFADHRVAATSSTHCCGPRDRSRRRWRLFRVAGIRVSTWSRPPPSGWPMELQSPWRLRAFRQERSSSWTTTASGGGSAPPTKLWSKNDLTHRDAKFPWPTPARRSTVTSWPPSPASLDCAAQPTRPSIPCDSSTRSRDPLQPARLFDSTEAIMEPRKEASGNPRRGSRSFRCNLADFDT